MDGFRFPKKIIYMGRFMTAKRIKAKGDVVACLYEDEFGLQTSFTERDFRYNELYGLIERRQEYDKG